MSDPNEARQDIATNAIVRRSLDQRAIKSAPLKQTFPRVIVPPRAICPRKVVCPSVMLMHVDHDTCWHYNSSYTFH